VKFRLEVEQSRQGSPDDQPAKTMPDERDVLQRSGGEELVDVVFDFIGQPVPHFDYISVSHLFVGSGAEVGDLRVVERDSILDQAHVHRIPLEAMDEHDEMQGSVSDNLLLLENT
jgi:hypothetical protein